VFNRVRLTTHPTRIDAAATTVLFAIPIASATQPSRLTIAAGDTVEYWGDYFNPANVEQRIGGTAQIAPAATTDYVANAAADGSGANKTGSVTVTAEYFASAVKFTITNGDAAAVSMTTLQCRGKGVYRDADLTLESTSSQPYGQRPVSIDLPYQNDPNVAQDLADYLLAQYESPASQAQSMTFNPHADPAAMVAALTGTYGDRVHVQETVTGLNADLFLQGMQLVVTPSMPPTPIHLEATWRLSPSIFASSFWILEDPASQLGINTVLGFG
jgi:hypothetical protein